MEELKPCPFCGGEAHLVDDYSSERDHMFYQVWHDCTTNSGAIRHAYGHALSLQISTPWCANEKDAVLLWNRRAERTCRDLTPTRREFTCSACGCEAEVYIHSEETGAYCPNCGARVDS